MGTFSINIIKKINTFYIVPVAFKIYDLCTCTCCSPLVHLRYYIPQRLNANTHETTIILLTIGLLRCVIVNIKL